MEKNILTINIGSSSKKYSLYKGERVLFSAHFEKDKDSFDVTYEGGQVEKISKNLFNDSLSVFFNAIKKEKHLQDDSSVLAIGIRLVAPGLYFTEDRIVNEEFLAKLSIVAERDMLHIGPVQTELIRVKELFGNIKVIAVSDSSFHKTLPRVAKNYSLPKKLIEENEVYRFGYHGISLGGIVNTLSSRLWGLEKKAIICHLGSGASITAVLDGKSVDTSMGYSPLEGLVMSSRVGSIDVGAILRMLDKKRVDELEEIFYKQSGLLAVSGLSDDMRVLIEAEQRGHIGAHNAIETFVYTIRKYIGMYVAVLGGVDVIIFSGTIGERSFVIRERICSGLSWLNVHLDNDKNLQAKSGDYIGKEGSLGVCVIHSDEDFEILRRVSTLL